MIVSCLFAAGCALGLENVDGYHESDMPLDPQDDTDGQSDCTGGMTVCGGVCVDLRSSHEHCGSCGSPCRDAELCNEGECVPECPAGKVDCVGSCVDTSRDPNNCGACSSRCPSQLNADPFCEGGSCAYRCQSGWSDLDDVPGCETECNHVSTNETCNGVDENCNGLIDEGFPCAMGARAACDTACGSRGMGTCGLDCELPTGSACSPPEEACNGVDDNCDGTVDDGFPCARGTQVSCTTACGTEGTGICTSTCQIPTGSSCPAAVAEICGNGIDDNCNGAVEEGCAVDADRDGYTSDIDCNDSNAAVHPGATEACNGIDDNCAGGTDEGSGLCTSSPGQCYASTGQCVGGGCVYNPLPNTTNCNDGNACTSGDRCDGSGNCRGTAMDCSRPHTTGGHCSGGSCTGWSCADSWENCNGNWSDGCEIPVGAATGCDAYGLSSTSGCGTAYCGSSSSSLAHNFGTWYCIGCSTCHHFTDGWSWCLTPNLGGEIQWSPDRCASCCSSSYENLVCAP